MAIGANVVTGTGTFWPNLASAGDPSAVLSCALYKDRVKEVLLRAGVPTPDSRVLRRPDDPCDLPFPLIVKPIAEGSSKGIAAKGVVDDEAALRSAVRGLIEKYRQPALVEEYIAGREFTVGLLGDRRPRVLPPMEICFKDKENVRPVYDYEVKQEWERHVYYQCPAKLTPQELQQIADQTGMTVEEVREKLAVGLPEVINHVTPDGEVPNDNELGGRLDRLGKYLPS